MTGSAYGIGGFAEKFQSHMEECQEQAFFSRIVCAAPGDMTVSVRNLSEKEDDRGILAAKSRKRNRRSEEV